MRELEEEASQERGTEPRGQKGNAEEAEGGAEEELPCRLQQEGSPQEADAMDQQHLSL